FCGATLFRAGGECIHPSGRCKTFFAFFREIRPFSLFSPPRPPASLVILTFHQFQACGLRRGRYPVSSPPPSRNCGLSSTAPQLKPHALPGAAWSLGEGPREPSPSLLRPLWPIAIGILVLARPSSPPPLAASSRLTALESRGPTR